jgi:hypothetical protein
MGDALRDIQNLAISRPAFRITHAHEKADEAAPSRPCIDLPCATADRSPQLLGSPHGRDLASFSQTLMRGSMSAFLTDSKAVQRFSPDTHPTSSRIHTSVIAVVTALNYQGISIQAPA